ncbi:MFS transporter [Skermania sp. ID1734]|uniref:MFS transporter n=1 Tax=Skermania sp. ID1734 TaxID=2597516 RepID=UPI00117C4DE7|nr:MFS transporter [Skermania sp. ID1734]TSD96586.1 MFS transporter [Skermania sp. ID1734]
MNAHDSQAPGTTDGRVSGRSSAGRWLVAAAVLGSGIAFLDGTVVNVALPSIGRDFSAGLTRQQWVLDGYLLTLSALLLAGGAAGDRYGRRRLFTGGLIVFALASVVCGLAPTSGWLIGARLVQGIGAAALVPGSLALIDAGITGVDRGRVVGIWAGMSGVTSAAGPLIGGWLVDVASWRWVFFLNVPLAIGGLAITGRHVTESRGAPAAGRPDVFGALTITLGLGGITYALIEIPTGGATPLTLAAFFVGATALVSFPLIERRVTAPLLPLGIFGSRQFSGANLTTLAVYAALGGALFLLALQLQQSMGYSALVAGLATVPITVIMLLGSPYAGAASARTGSRAPMTLGPLIAAAGLGLLARAVPGAHYPSAMLPALVVFGIGLAITVAPLTTAVLAAVSDDDAGAASGINNAIARAAGLLAVAILPVAAGIHPGPGQSLGDGFPRAMIIAAALCAAGGVVAFFTVRTATPVTAHPLPGVNHACQHPCTRNTPTQASPTHE